MGPARARELVEGAGAGDVLSPFATVAEQAAAIRCGQCSARELVDRALARIARFNPDLNAIVVMRADEARREAVKLDREHAEGRLRGPLHGVPVTVKEAFDVAGLKTTVNSRLMRNNVATRDALIVRRLREAGAVIIGKSNVPSWLADYQCFGPLYPAAANPFDYSRTPGGSGGGGAAAVAAGLSTLDIGSDLAGSIRVPAHFCGVFALKPGDNFARLGAGHVPPLPQRPARLVPMVAIGALARSMADIDVAWRALDAAAGDDCSGAPLPAPRLLRIGWFDTIGDIGCDSDTQAVLQIWLRQLAALGVTVEKRPFARTWLDEAYEIWALLAGAMAGQGASWPARQVMKWAFGWARDATSIDALRAWTRGLDLTATEIEGVLSRRDDLIGDFERRFATCGFLIGPVAAGPAFPHDRKRGPILRDGVRYPYLDDAMPFSVIANACGNPVLVVPAGQSADGLPIGLQIAAPRGAEARLIAFGRWLEAQGAAFVPPPGFGVS